MSEKAPRSISPEDAKELMASSSPGGFLLLDVREHWEYEEFHLPGAVLMPLGELPERIKTLAQYKKIPVLAYCSQGVRSFAAASMLMGRGFHQVMNVKGGVMAWQGGYAVGPPEMGLDLFSKARTPEDMLALAYAMEKNLGAFYRQAALKAPPPMQKTFETLAGYEKAHMKKVLLLAQRLLSNPLDENLLDIKATALEGGIEPQVFWEEYGHFLETPKGILETAMMFEGQAWDLYMRLFAKDFEANVKEVLNALVIEEKEHLKVLSRLLKREVEIKK